MSINDLSTLNTEKRWHEIIKLTDEKVDSLKASDWFFRGNALMNLAQYHESEAAILKGLKLNNSNSWGHSILFLCRKNGLLDVDNALKEFFEFVLTVDPSNEGCKTFFVDEAVKLNKFDEAAIINEKRRVISGPNLEGAKYAVAIQCFNKADTLDKVFERLCECEESNKFGLVILQDSLEGSSKKDKFTKGALEVKSMIASWLPQLLANFSSVEIMSNPENLGTAPSCRRLLDHVCSNYEGFLFLEDDCLVSKDALSWSLYCLNSLISPYKCWFASCESVFFNSGGKEVTDESLNKLIAISSAPQIANAYIELDFVPSTCFITTKDIWSFCKKIRSLVRGPESLTAFLKASNKKTCSPVVPRAEDIGMLHENGYSVDILGVDNVKEIKTTYLISQSSKKSFEHTPPSLYRENVNRLYASTVKFDQSLIDQIYLEVC